MLGRISWLAEFEQTGLSELLQMRQVSASRLEEFTMIHHLATRFESLQNPSRRR